MQAKEFEAFIASGDIARVTIYRPALDSAWSVFGYGETLPPVIVNHIALNEGGSKRLWADIDAVYTFIRKSGFRQSIEIDG